MKNSASHWVSTALLLAVFAVACAPKKPPQLIPFINDYNNMIRWGQPDKAGPYVNPDDYPEFRKWAKENDKKYNYQEWSMEAVTYETETTATVVIERKGFEIPKYVEKTFPSVQSWVYIEGLGWRIKSGF